MRKKYIVVYLLLIFLFFLSGCGNSQKDSANKEKKVYGTSIPIFSYYPDKLLYVESVGSDPYSTNYNKIISYDISTNKAFIIAEGQIPYGGPPIYSWDGKKIAYATIKNGNSNICIMDADGKNIKQLTHDHNDRSNQIDTNTGKASRVRYNIAPSFSQDGKKIIFKRAHILRQRALNRGKMYSEWDVFEIETETGKEKRLTNYQFYEMSNPYYLPDGKRFIFSAYGPIAMGKTFREQYEKQYQWNNIFIMDGENNHLRPAIINGRWSSDPVVARDGSILFLSITNEMDNLPRNPYHYDIFFKKGDTITRVTRMQGYINDASISFDGSMIVFGLIKQIKGESTVVRYIVNSDGSGLTEIRKPGYEMVTERINTTK